MTALGARALRLADHVTIAMHTPMSRLATPKGAFAASAEVASKFAIKTPEPGQAWSAVIDLPHRYEASVINAWGAGEHAIRGNQLHISGVSNDIGRSGFTVLGQVDGFVGPGLLRDDKVMTITDDVIPELVSVTGGERLRFGDARRIEVSAPIGWERHASSGQLDAPTAHSAVARPHFAAETQRGDRFAIQLQHTGKFGDQTVSGVAHLGHEARALGEGVAGLAYFPWAPAAGGSLWSRLLRG